jgi:glucose-1-phosphate adenylyltransferase
MNNRFKPDLSRTQALILAGGQGKHLFPLTANRPTPAMPFGGIFRIVDFTLANCLRSKLPNVALLTQYQHQQLCSYIRYAWSGVWKNSRHASEPLVCVPPSEGNRYRGTADAVFKNIKLLQSGRPDYVLILSGDQIYSMDYREIFERHVELQADLTVATVERPLAAACRFRVIGVDQNFAVTGTEHKPQNPTPLPLRPGRALISMGVYLFNTDILLQSLIENCQTRFGYDFERDIISSLIGSARVYAYNCRDEFQDAPRYWRDIGNIDGYYEASMDLLRLDRALTETEIGTASQFIPHRSAAGSNIGCSRGSGIHIYSRVSHTVLSAGVRIERRANVQDSVLMPGVWIGSGAAVRHAIIDEGVHIPAGFRIGWDINQDRQRYVVSPAGVVVVGQTPEHRNPVTDFEAFGHSGSLRASA